MNKNEESSSPFGWKRIKGILSNAPEYFKQILLTSCLTGICSNRFLQDSKELQSFIES